MITEAQKEALYVCARQCDQLCEQMYRSLSGADVADAEVYACERRVYAAVAAGTDLDTALAAEDKRWRAYAAEQAKKVADAPKIKRGPSAGHSAIGHRWVSPEKFASKYPHIRFMVNRAMGAV